MFLHGVTVTEGAAAERAAVRPLTRVDAQVSPQVSSLAEALGAEGAAVWPLARVRAQVAPQVSGLSEGLAAPVAGVCLPLLLQVEAEAVGLAERLAAAGTAMHKLREEAGDRGSSDRGSINWLLLLRGLPVFISIMSHRRPPVCLHTAPEARLFCRSMYARRNMCICCHLCARRYRLC